MQMTMNGRRWILALTALTALVIVPASAEELKLWRHGIVEAKSDAGIVFMGSKGGFAEKQRLEIDIQQFKGDTLALKALLAGELDSYEGNPGSPMVAASRGADIKLVGCYWPGLTYAIYSRVSIQSPAELKGKTFAISAPGALPDLVARAVLAQNNVAAADVKFTIMGSDADRFKALTAGIVDAAAASSGFAPEAEGRRQDARSCHRRRSELRSFLHLFDRQDPLCAQGRRRAFSCRRDRRVSLCPDESRPDTRVDTRDHTGQAGQSAARFHLR